MCLKVCPFFDGNDNEDIIGKRLFSDIPEIKHTSETGYFLDCFVGYSNVNKHRENGASGGLATWTMETLLEKGLVDHAICVSPMPGSDPLFKFVVCKTPEQIRACSRSCYYPVETSEVLRHVLSNDGRYAVIGLPCVCKAVRLAMEINQKLRQRIRYVLGLTCNQLKSRPFLEYMAGAKTGSPTRLKRVLFRVKDRNRPACDFGIKCVLQNDVEKTFFWTNGMYRVWSDGYFTPNPCNFCDDVFAECADTTFMDAWLPQYYKDWAGYNIVLSRSAAISSLLNASSKSAETSISCIAIDDVIKSQRGAIRRKRHDLAIRASMCRTLGQAVPQKRVSSRRSYVFSIRSHVVKLALLTSQKSRDEWLRNRGNRVPFDKAMQPIAIRRAVLRRVENAMCMPRTLLRRFFARL
jgi:coenzyme F420-reducing hydrogenase beta subunit